MMAQMSPHIDVTHLSRRSLFAWLGSPISTALPCRPDVASDCPHAVPGYVETAEVAWHLGDQECLS